jgi:hypothetical protein
LSLSRLHCVTVFGTQPILIHLAIMGRKTLANERDKQEIVERAKKIQPSSVRRWGKMTAHQMLCHLCDSFRGPMGTRHLSAGKMPGPPSLAKWIALNSPFRWPHGIKTRPEADQFMGGTPPVDFETDRTELLVLLEQFCTSAKDCESRAHPILGFMSQEEWLRWGYLHMDHHLRQFGV